MRFGFHNGEDLQWVFANWLAEAFVIADAEPRAWPCWLLR
jgi:hypothetical protein